MLQQVVKARVSIEDESLLKVKCQQQQVRTNYAANPHCWVFDLLKAGASQISSLEEYGCRLKVEYSSLTLTDLKEDIDKDFYTLSEAHYHRYFDAKHIELYE